MSGIAVQVPESDGKSRIEGRCQRRVLESEDYGKTGGRVRLIVWENEIDFHGCGKRDRRNDARGHPENGDWQQHIGG